MDLEKHSNRHVKFLTCGAAVAPFTTAFFPPSPSDSASHLSLLSLPLPTPVRLPLSFNSLLASSLGWSKPLSGSSGLSSVGSCVCLQLVPQQAGKPFGKESLNRPIHTSVDSLMHFRVLQPFLNPSAEFLFVYLIVPPFRFGPPTSLEVLSFVFWLILQTIINEETERAQPWTTSHTCVCPYGCSTLFPCLTDVRQHRRHAPYSTFPLCSFLLLTYRLLVPLWPPFCRVLCIFFFTFSLLSIVKIKKKKIKINYRQASIVYYGIVSRRAWILWRNEGHHLRDVRVIRRYHISTPAEKITFHIWLIYLFISYRRLFAVGQS